MRDRRDAVLASRRWRTNRVGMCLATVQEWFGSGHAYPWAEAAWNAAKRKHRGDHHPPPGVPVFWHNPRSKYGHIAIAVGGGMVRSTDWPSAGHVGEAHLDDVTRRWGLVYLGWAEDLPPGGTVPR